VCVCVYVCVRGVELSIHSLDINPFLTAQVIKHRIFRTL
jgi:hypothetical protein